MELKTYFAQDAAGNIISSAIVNVFLQGTTTLATGLTRADGTPLDNPFAADGAGRIQFRAPDGYYDVQVSAGSGIIQTLTIQCVDYSGAKADADRAEAAADRADVSAEQAQNALNSITGINTNFEQNSREQWRRLLAEAGLTLVSGSFEEGATANNKTDAVWYIAGGQCYTWDSTFPRDVPAKSTPASTGGVGLGAWVIVGDGVLRSVLTGTGGADFVKTSDGQSIQHHLDGTELDISKVKSQHTNDHRYKVIFEMPLRFSSYNAVIAAGGYDYLYPSGHFIDHVANELWVFYPATGGDSASWYVVYDLTTLVEKTYFKAGIRWSKTFTLRYSGGSRYLYSRSMTTLWLAKFDVTSLPTAGSTITDMTPPRDSVKAVHAGVLGNEILVAYDAPTTNTTPYSNTFNILDADTWAFKRSIRMDTVGAGNEYGATPFIYKNQGTVMTPNGIAMAFGGMTDSTDSATSDTDLRIVQGIVVKTEEGVTVSTGLFDPFKGMALLTTAGYPATRFEHEGIFYDQVTKKISTIWHYTEDAAGKFLIVEAFSGETDAIDMKTAAIIPRPKVADIIRLFRSNFAVNYPVNPVTGEGLPDVTNIITMLINHDMSGAEWYTSNFSALTFNGATMTGSLRAILFRCTNTTFNLYLDGSGLNQKWQITISGSTYTYTQMATYVTSLRFANGVSLNSGTGSPEGVLTAPPASKYYRTDGGAGTLEYRKATGTGNTGWVALS